METGPDPEFQPSLIPESDLASALGLLCGGRVIVYPTETLYGLMADAFCEPALLRIAALKGRPARQALPCIVGDEKGLLRLAARIEPGHRALMERFWPGPLTLLFEARPEVPDLLTGGTGAVGVRITSHPSARELARRFGPLAATSANRAGEPTLRDASKIRTIFPDLAVFDGGRLPESKGSTVLDVRAGLLKMVRPGDVPAALIEEVLNVRIGNS